MSGGRIAGVGVVVVRVREGEGEGERDFVLRPRRDPFGHSLRRDEVLLADEIDDDGEELVG